MVLKPYFNVLSNNLVDEKKSCFIHIEREEVYLSSKKLVCRRDAK